MSTSNRLKTVPPRPRGQGKNALMVWGIILLVCAAALLGTYLLFVKAPPPGKIVIAAGAKNGTYYKIGLQYAEELKKEGLAVEVRETAGSGENLQLLRDAGSGVSVALVQSGVADEKDDKDLQTLGSLFREPLWVFYRGDPTIELLKQLEGKRISVGPKTSGTYPIATKLLAANGLPEAGDAAPEKRTILETPDKIADAATKLQKGELDAAFFVAAFDTGYIQELLKDGNIHLLSFSQQEAYHRRYRFLSELTVPAGLVNLGQNLPSKDVYLLAPTAMLVAQGREPGPDSLAAHRRHAHSWQGRRAFQPRRVSLRVLHRHSDQRGR